MISHKEFHDDGFGEENGGDAEPNNGKFDKQSRFSVYPDEERLVLAKAKKLKQLKTRYNELCKLASIVLDTPISEMSEDQVHKFIEENK